jgi:hypothetical protein
VDSRKVTTPLYVPFFTPHLVIYLIKVSGAGPTYHWVAVSAVSPATLLLRAIPRSAAPNLKKITLSNLALLIVAFPALQDFSARLGPYSGYLVLRGKAAMQTGSQHSEIMIILVIFS